VQTGNTVICIPIARQWLRKCIPTKHVHATIRCPLLDNGQVNNFPLNRVKYRESLAKQWDDGQDSSKIQAVFFVEPVQNGYKRDEFRSWQLHPCGGGVEYLHRYPANRRRRRKEKSQIWDSKIWSWVPRNSDPWKTTLARASGIYKRQTRTLVREDAPQKQDRNCQRVIHIWSWALDGAQHQYLLIDWPSVAMWLWLWLTVVVGAQNSSRKRIGLSLRNWQLQEMARRLHRDLKW
jgi:hypothetical protein